MFERMKMLSDKIFQSDITKKPPRAPSHEVWKSLIGSFLGILTIAAIDKFWLSEHFDNVELLYGSFGASAVLLFDAYKSPLAQPWNALFGQALSATIGVSIRLFCTYAIVIPPYIQAALAVSIAIAMMDLMDCLHPPGGATALTAIIGGMKVHRMGYMYVLYIGMYWIIVYIE